MRNTTVKDPMDGIGGTIKKVVFCTVKSGLVTIYTPAEFHQAVTKFLPAIKCIYLSDKELLKEPENIDHESKAIAKTLQVHKVERCEIKGVYYLKFFI